MSTPVKPRSDRVLVIDKDNVRRGMVACTVEDSGYHLEFANSPEAGLDLLRMLEPDVVIVGQDTGPPDICQRIRAQQAGSGCLLVVMDESFDNESFGETSAEDCGADTFLPFPFERSLFEHRVAAGKRRRRQQTTARLRASPLEPSSKRLPGGDTDDAQASTQNETEQWRCFRQEVADAYDRLESCDYYQVLRVEPSASMKDLKDAYFGLSLRFHPDRFILHGDEQLKGEVYEVYKRLSEAFMVLIDPVSRRQYDSQLDAERKLGNLRFKRPEASVFEAHPEAGDAKTPLGRRYLYFSLRAKEEGRLRTACSYLNMALQHEPRNKALRRRLSDVKDEIAASQVE